MELIKKNNKTNIKLSLILLILPLLFEYREIISGGFSFFFRDFSIFTLPNAFYVRECFLHNELPIWNPLNEFGIPFLAQWNTMVLYPFNLIFFIVPPEFGFSIFPLLHLIFGGIGMFLLSKRLIDNEAGALISALGYEFNGITINSLMWTNNSAAFGWMPWVVLSVLLTIHSNKTKNFIFLVVVTAIQFLTGAPEIIGFTWAISFIFVLNSLVKSSERLTIIKKWAIVVIATLALVSIQLLPFLHLLANSHRVSAGGDLAWSLNSLLNLISPFYNSFEWNYGVVFNRDQYWTSSIYIPLGIVWSGISGALLSDWKDKWILIILCLAGILLSAGNNFFLYPLLKSVLPVLEMIRFPVKFIILYLFSILILAGLGFNSICQRKTFNKNNIPIYVLVVLSIFLVISVIIYPADSNIGLPRTTILNNVVFRGVFLILFALICYVLENKMRSPQSFILLAAALIIFDFKTHAPKQNPSVESWVYAPYLLKNERPPGFNNGRILTRHDKDYFKFNKNRNDAVTEILTKRLGLYSNLNLLEGYEKLTGVFSLHLTHSRMILDKIYEDEKQIHSGIADFLGITWIPETGKQFSWKYRTNAFSLISGGQRTQLENETDCFAKIFSENFNPRTVVFLPENSDPDLEKIELANLQIQLEDRSPVMLKAKTSCDKTSIVVISIAHYPCWKAFVNGKRAQVYKANYGFNAIVIPSGKNQIIFHYKDWLFIPGIFISCVSFVLISRVAILFSGMNGKTTQNGVD